MSAKGRRMVDVCWVAVDDVFQDARDDDGSALFSSDVPMEYAYSVEGEIIEAAGAALEAMRRNPDAVVTLVFGRIPEGSQ